MKNLLFISFITLLFAGSCTTKQSEQTEKEQVDSVLTAEKVLVKDDLSTTVNNALAFSAQQIKIAAANYEDTVFPRTLKDGKVKYVKGSDWVSGFFPATLWYVYSYTKDSVFKNKALKYFEVLEAEKFNTKTHDLGFMIFCPYGNAVKFDPENKEKYTDVILQATESLCSRFNPQVGCIRSWDHGSWTYPVIIDNMMNLEMIWWAAQQSGADSARFSNVATTHANTTMKKHFRPDHSTYHVIDYDPKTGMVLASKTHQGYSDSSAWARGQSWGLYGYTMGYRMTKDPAYLIKAKKIAEFILGHENYPEDGVPYWDFNDPAIPNTPRDASAGAIMANALLELSGFDEVNKDYFKKAAENILFTLSSTEFLDGSEANGYWLLKHSVGSKPHNSEVDVPLNYADYYYIEALLRWKEMYGK